LYNGTCSTRARRQEISFLKRNIFPKLPVNLQMTSDRPSDGLRVPNIDKVRSWRVPALQPISRVIHPRPNASHCEVPTHTLTLFHDSSTSRFVVFGCLLQNQSLRNLYSPHLQNNILTTGYVLVLIGTKCFKEKWQKVKPKKNTAPQMQ